MSKIVNDTCSSKTNTPGIALIVLNWNGWKDTIECLESVFRINYENLVVICLKKEDTQLIQYKEFKRWLI